MVIYGHLAASNVHKREVDGHGAAGLFHLIVSIKTRNKPAIKTG